MINYVLHFRGCYDSGSKFKYKVCYNSFSLFGIWEKGHLRSHGYQQALI